MTEFAYTALCFFIAIIPFAGLSYCILYPIFNGKIKKEIKNEKTDRE
jgi:cbb3-type cytochrome oxidase subunit 3